MYRVANRSSPIPPLSTGDLWLLLQQLLRQHQQGLTHSISNLTDYVTNGPKVHRAIIGVSFHKHLWCMVLSSQVHHIHIGKVFEGGNTLIPVDEFIAATVPNQVGQPDTRCVNFRLWIAFTILVGNQESCETFHN